MMHANVQNMKQLQAHLSVCLSVSASKYSGATACIWQYLAMQSNNTLICPKHCLPIVLDVTIVDNYITMCTAATSIKQPNNSHPWVTTLGRLDCHIHVKCC